MAVPDGDVPARSARRGQKSFETTRWTLVAEAGRGGGSGLAALCEAYWMPLYCCVRRHGRSPEEAEDLTQEFFAKLLRNESIAKADPTKGRFRSWLVRSLENHLRNDHRDRTAGKRGGKEPTISMEAMEAEEWYQLDAEDGLSPAAVFDRQWARTLIYQTLDRLRSEFELSGRSGLFDALEPQLWNDPTAVPYETLAATLGMSSGSLRVTVHRLRKRFDEMLREAVSMTVSIDSEIEDELSTLLHALRGQSHR